MTLHVPSDAEIHAAARELGLLDAQGQVPPGKRAQIARAVQIAANETRVDEVVAGSGESFARRVRRVQDELDSAGVRPEATVTVLGAISAQLWRDTKEIKQ